MVPGLFCWCNILREIMYNTHTCTEKYRTIFYFLACYSFFRWISVLVIQIYTHLPLIIKRTMFLSVHFRIVNFSTRCNYHNFDFITIILTINIWCHSLHLLILFTSSLWSVSITMLTGANRELCCTRDGTKIVLYDALVDATLFSINSSCCHHSVYNYVREYFLTLNVKALPIVNMY